MKNPDPGGFLCNCFLRDAVSVVANLDDN